MMKRIILCLLALLTVASCLTFVGCKKDQGSEQTPPPSMPSMEAGEGNASLTLPSDLNYGGEEFNILIYNTMVDEFGMEDIDESDSIQEALFNRDAYIEEQLGVAFNYFKMNGQFADKETFFNTVSTSVMGNSKSWDLIGTYSMVAPALTLNNVLVDMRTLNNVDFTRAWYPQFMLDASTINNKTYFATGDASTNVLYAMQGVAFNATAAAARGIYEDDLYQMVYDGEWTLESMFSICEDLGTELGGDGVWDANDFYPIITSNAACLDSFYFSSGLTLINENEDGKLSISSDVLSEKVLSVYSMIYDAKQTYKSFYDSTNENTIMEERCIFSISPMINFRSNWAESKEQFRILPFPKYAEGSTSEYQTFLSMWHTQYCIPNDIDDYERSGAVFEYLGYTSYNNVTPVIFEETMKLRYSENEDCAKMFDIMRNGCTYGVASLFYMSFTPGVYWDAHSMFRNAVISNTTGWVSHYETKYKAGLEYVTGLLNDFYGDN